MGYAKSIISSDFKNCDKIEEDEQFFNAKIKNNNEDSNTKDTEVSDKNNSSVTFVNGKMASEKDLAVEIRKVQDEVNELTNEYEQIMGGEGSIELKIRLSQPTGKRLQERLQDLQSLKSQAKDLEMQKVLKTA